LHAGEPFQQQDGGGTGILQAGNVAFASRGGEYPALFSRPRAVAFG
jgi:hypothetical protein